MIVEHLEPIIYNDTLKSFNENVENALKIINATTKALNSSTMENVIKKKTFISDIFTNINEAESILTKNEKFFAENNVTALLNATLR